MKVIIVYELYEREYDNALLLRAELLRRGYSVEIIYKNDMVAHKKSEENTIVIVPNCYRTDMYENYFYSLNNYNSTIIDMQYEQIYAEDKKDRDIHMPTGMAKEIRHVCWGDNNYSLLLNDGIKSSNLLKIGAIQLDFLREEFSEYWKTKSQIAAEYGIDLDSDWVLFISSFALADNAFIREGMSKVYGEDYIADLEKIHTESRRIFLDWIDQLLETEKEINFIYRKHPEEKISPQMRILNKKYKNRIHFISDYNVKQWIFICEKIYTWYSTSIAECIVAKKSVNVIRPQTIPSKYDIDIFNKCKHIKNVVDFKKSLSIFDGLDQDESFINENYYIPEKPTYILLCDEIDRLSERGNKCKISRKYYARKRFWFTVKNNLYIKYVLKHFYQFLCREMNFKIQNNYLRKKFSIASWEQQATLPDIYEKETKLNRIVSLNS